MKALSFGEILWDVYPNKKCLGGAPLNFAAHFAKQGGESYMLSALGDDELGKAALKKLSDWEVSSEYISVLKNRPTGRCVVTLNKQSVPSYDILQDVAYDHIPLKPVSDSIGRMAVVMRNCFLLGFEFTVFKFSHQISAVSTAENPFAIPV